jgi:hypothetical protein
MKVEFYEFFSFLRSRRPFPFLYGINRGFCQQRIAANHLSELRLSAGRNHDSHPDGSMNLRSAGQVWIDWDHSVDYRPLSFWLVLSERSEWAEGNYSQRKRDEGGYKKGSHGWLFHQG